MTALDQKAILKIYLQEGREAMLWKLEGLNEYDLRRPLVPTATNLLGLVKHVAAMDGEYFGRVFSRPFPGGFPSLSDNAPPNADMWATPDESSAYLIDLYKRVWEHSDATIDELNLDAPGVVPWWSEKSKNTTLGRILVHMVVETQHHLGHADIARELIDGEAGLRDNNSNLPERDQDWWAEYRSEAEAAAMRFRSDNSGNPNGEAGSAALLR
jgi:uncharacterized damage-inducible protein DinB